MKCILEHMIVNLFTKQYEARNCLKWDITIEVATVNNTDDFHYKQSHCMCNQKNNTNWHVSMSAKMKETQRRTLVSPRRMYCMYCFGTPLDEAMPDSEKNQPIALAVIELR